MMPTSGRSRITVITTGGTFGGVPDPGQPIAKRQGPTDWTGRIFQHAPGLEDRIDLQFDDFMNLFSEDMLPLDWARLAQRAGEWIGEGIDGVVVTHGTDTLAHTGAALSLMLANPPVPVVVTGATKPFEEQGSDGIPNLCDSIRLAAEPSLRGVFVVFGSKVHLGTRVRKMTSTVNAFESINHEPLGTVHGLAVDLRQDAALPRRGNGQFEILAGLDPAVAFFKVYPGFAPLWLELAMRTHKAILLELYPEGAACTLEASPYSLKPALEEARRRGIPAFATSQQASTLNLTVYESTSRLYDAGVVSLHDMTTEAALPKLMWVLGRTSDVDEIKDLMLSNLAGETFEMEECQLSADQPYPHRPWQDVLGDDPRLASARKLATRFEALVRSRFPDEPDREGILRALATMIALHRKQKPRPEGTPYVVHPLEVALDVLLRFGRRDPDVLIAALLHDSVEDQAKKLVAPGLAASLSRQDLNERALRTLELGFGPRVAKLVGALVNPFPDEPSGSLPSDWDEAEKEKQKHRLYWEHFEGLWDGDPDALLIKLADFSQNALRLDRLDEGRTKDKLRRKYGPVVQTSIARVERLADSAHPLFGAKDWLLSSLREAYARDYSFSQQ